MTIQLKNNVFWVGKQDWSLREFHGGEYITPKGSSYNSYLIREQKNVLIDTVWSPYSEEFIHNLEEEINLNDIDYIVINHAEIDHSGALPALMAKIPNTPIYCTANCVKSLKGHYHKDWQFNVVKTGDFLELGNGKTLTFITAQMLHWPDSMMCYLNQDNILFSNDAFGQHYASEQLFNDCVDQYELQQECMKYFVNILTPYRPILKKKLKELAELNLTIDLICPSHGMIWRDNPQQVIDAYQTWSSDYSENQITIVYETMWNSTRLMAEAIAKGVRQADKNIIVKQYHLSLSDKNEVITELFKSKVILIGSPTSNNVMLPHVAGLLEEVQGLKFSDRLAGAFGSHGWSGTAVDRISTRLQECGFSVVDGIKLSWKPTSEDLKTCEKYGEEIIKTLNNK